MSEEIKRPKPGEVFWNEDEEDTEIAEILSEATDGSFLVADEDGEESSVTWNAENERWEVSP